MMSVTEQLAQSARRVDAAPAGAVPSPCISVCKMDPATQLCEGCFRTLDEIAAWSGLSEQGKREIWRRIGGQALAHATNRPKEESP